MQTLWIVLTVLVAAAGGWPVTAGILRLAKTADIREASNVHREPSAQLPTEGPDQPGADESPDLSRQADADGSRTGLQGASPQVSSAPDVTLETMPDALPSGTSELTNSTVLRGGLVIGFLERAGVVLAILADQSVAIAYIVAIKGLGRYPELKQTPAASERFIIGTLSSMLWAAGLATLAKWLLLG